MWNHNSIKRITMSCNLLILFIGFIMMTPQLFINYKLKSVGKFMLRFPYFYYKLIGLFKILKSLLYYIFILLYPAHLPWRMMTYKALNTFIDDIFAFVIKMPTMYRIGCFRDDIVFFIFLYLRYIYRVR